MNKRLWFKKTVAWSLIAAIVNPAAIAPALARDTDIFLTVTASSTTVEPNVLLVLGTNDRMNIPEPWREYPGDYDSHTEYLWNDISIIGNSEATAEIATQISTAEQTINPFSPYGFWAGTTLAQRQALWTAAKTYANATEPGDPGPRSTWRDYNDLALLYWVPSQTAGVDTPFTDARLRSVSLNTFRGHRNVVAGVRGGIPFTSAAPYPRDETTPGNSPLPTSGVWDYRSLNQCATSIPLLTPSTVFAPDTAPKNAGMMLNQQWLRYDRWSNLTPINLAGYPGTAAQGGGGATSAGYYRGYLDSVVAPTQVAPGFPVPPSGPAGTPPTNTYRDDDRGRYNGVLGMPIRLPVPASYAGWTDLKADSGGFELLYRAYYYQFGLSGFNSNPAGLLPTLRSVYGYTKLNSGDTYDEVLSAYKGNRDLTPAFGMSVGTNAYYDQTFGNCSPTTGPSPNTSPTNTTCINVPVAGAPAQNATWRQNCSGSGAITSELDATNTIRYKGVGLTCTNNGAPTCVSDPRGLNCVGLTPPPLSCTAGIQNQFFTRHYDTSCSFSGQTPVTVNTCQWSGRQTVFIEGQGTYFYGGTCQESGSTAHCSPSGTSTRTLNNVSQSNVLGAYTGQPPANGTTTLGCVNTLAAGTYNSGGTCGGGVEYTVSTSLAPYPALPRALKTPTDCAVSGGTTLNIRGTGNKVYNRTCAGLGEADQTCTTRYGAACLTGASVSGVCVPSVSGTAVAIPASSAVNRRYQTYRLQASDSNLVHDCLADQPAFNAGANSYMTSAQLTFGAAWSGTNSYTTNAAQSVVADDTKKINVYSVNWLNWKFGPKGPNGAPIGRKTRLQIAKDALSNLVQTTDGVRFGLMVHNRTASTLTNDGANVVFAIKRMGSNSADPDYVNRAAMVTAINSVVASSRTPLTETLYEAYLYYSGRAPRFGTATTTALIGGTVTQGRDTTAVCGATVSADCPVPNAYRSPMLYNPNTTTPGTCQKNFVVMITNGQPEDDAAVNTDIKSMVSTVSAGNTLSPVTTVDTNEADTASSQFELSGTPYGPIDAAGTSSDGGYIWLDELAYFMSKADVSPGAHNFATDSGTDLISGRQSITTYTIGFAGVPSPVVANAAAKSGGVYYDAQDSASLGAALVDAIAAIREWNPTVAAPSVPVSALNRAENADDVYLSFFKPDPSQAWDGTLKRFRLGTTAAECGTDATPAHNPITLCLTSKVVSSGGFLNIEKQEVQPDNTVNIVIDDAAESYWTPTPDGSKPTLGGTGYQVINTAAFTPKTRKVYSWFSGVSTSADTTAAANQVTEANTATTANSGGKITKAMLGLAAGASTDVTALNLINYIRGGNAIGACADGDPATDCVTWRAWAHADVQHSRPAVVTYDPSPIDDTQVPSLQQPAKRANTQYLYYLSNDGLLHAVDANTGKEQWVFLVEEALPQLKTLQTDGAGQQLNIADGSPVAWIKDVNGNGKIESADGDKVYLYFGLRRGGRAYYALDVTQKDAPTMLWKISNTATCGSLGTSCTASTVYSELAQSWSNPAVGSIRKLGVGVPAVIFGGGYDPNQDNYKVTAADTMGRALFVVNGQNGNLVQSFGAGQSGDMSLTGVAMTYSVPSDPSALNTDQDAQGFFDRVYVGDTGGYLWRFDINNPVETLWTGKLLANLSSDTLSTTDRRKIFFPPAVVKQDFGVAGRFDAVYVGTGDREHPTKTQTMSPATLDSVPPAPNDKIFMLKDPDWDVNQPVSATTYTFASLLQLTGGIGITDAALKLSGGWYLDLQSDCTPQGAPPVVSCGEKVTSAPTVFFNKLRFGTYTPTVQANACVPSGVGRLNEIDALTGAFTINLPSNGSPSRDRYYSGFLARGYVSTGQLVVVGKNIYNITVADGRLQSILVGTIGAATKVYWYMEPEL